MISQNVRVQVNFTAPSEFGDYSDALYFSPEEFASLTEERLQEMEAERVSKWVSAIKAAQEAAELEAEGTDVTP